MLKFIEVKSVVNEDNEYICINTLIDIDEISSMRYLTKKQIDEIKNNYDPDDEDSVSPNTIFAQLSMKNGNTIIIHGKTALEIKDIIVRQYDSFINLADDDEPEDISVNKCEKCAIKDQYENKLKTSMISMLSDLGSELGGEKQDTKHLSYDDLEKAESYNNGIENCIDTIKDKINKLREE